MCLAALSWRCGSCLWTRGGWAPLARFSPPVFSFPFLKNALGLRKVKEVQPFVHWIKLDSRFFHSNIFGFEFFIVFTLFFNIIIWHLIFILNLALVILIFIFFIYFFNWNWFLISFLIVWFHLFSLSNLVLVLFNFIFFLTIFFKILSLVILVGWEFDIAIFLGFPFAV